MTDTTTTSIERIERIKRLGRAPAVNGVVVTTRISNELYEILADIARKYEVGMSTLIRAMVIAQLTHTQLEEVLAIIA